MDWFFSKEPTVKEKQRENEKALRKANRDIDRDRRELEREEKKLEMEIKKSAKEGNHLACKILAKQLVQVRKQKTRTYGLTSKVTGVRSQNRMIGTNAKLTEAIATTTKTMKNMNDLTKPEKFAVDMRAFQESSMKMNMTDEMINDTLDDIMNESGDESESEAIVNQVLDEIGIEISSRMAAAPSTRSSLGEATRSKQSSDRDLEQQLARLRSN